ncbi:hypothetical protein L3Q82_009156 [Scortum barcoo]|uniref:Uncharacterized protein n=1 Tax=Scortum barcoo TaxID=214431 RepID=A0ACB8XB51_9TELE|nr:hypothetical protein L3Q82_009156 [Scortum barcoo]
MYVSVTPSTRKTAFSLRWFAMVCRPAVEIYAGKWFRGGFATKGKLSNRWKTASLSSCPHMQTHQTHQAFQAHLALRLKMAGVYVRRALPHCHDDLRLEISSGYMGQRSVAGYTLEFRTLAAELNWTWDVLRMAFVNGLSECMKAKLAFFRDEPTNFNNLINLTRSTDARRL